MTRLALLLWLVVLLGGCAPWPQSATTATLSIRDGQREVATAKSLDFVFNRPVDLSTFAHSLRFNPAIEGELVPNGDGRRFSWTTTSGWLEATAYRITLGPFRDLQGNLVPARSLTFVTTIVPRVLAVADESGQLLAPGDEVGQGAPITLLFNSPMSFETTVVNAGGKPAKLTWSGDGLSAAVATDTVAAGSLDLALVEGGDLFGHPAATHWTFHLELSYQVRIATRHLPFPALVQIPNDGYGARPQVGIQAAAMVFEYQTEGSIQRLTALYTDVPEVVGPTRSGRRISFRLTRHYHGNLFLSGLSNDAMAQLRADPVPAWFDNPPGFFRVGNRSAPNNLMIRGDAVLAAEQASRTPAFAPLKTGHLVLAGGDPATGFYVAEHRSNYSYDPLTQTYSKVEDGDTMTDASLGKPDQLFMVLVMHAREFLVHDIEDGCCVHGRDFDLDSGGALDVYYRGVHLAGSWSAADRASPFVFKLASGAELTLPRGLVWVDVVGA